MRLGFIAIALAATSALALGAAHADSSTYYFRLRPSVQIQNQETFSVRINGDREGIVGSSFSAKAEASSPKETLHFSVTGGNLPPGVSLDSTTGSISGQPLARGRFAATITAQDAFSTASAPLSVTVYDELSIESTVSSYATVGQPYSASFRALGGDAAYDWTLSGTPPTGLALANASSSTTSLSGTPVATGTWSNLRVNLSDGAGHETSSLPFSISVADPLTLAGEAATVATIGESYTATFTSSGGHAPISWSLSGNALPEGLSFANGTISGVPTRSETATGLVVRVSDAAGTVKSSSPFSIAVSQPLTLSGTAADIGTVGSPYNASFTATGGNGSYAWVIANGSLPDGLTLTNGAISGSPTKVGDWTGIVIRVTDGDGRSKEADPFSILVSNPLTLSGVLTNSATVGQFYSSTLTASGGRGSYQWTATGIPAGLNLSGDTLSGTPTAAGTASVVVKVMDQDGRSAQTQAMTIAIVVPTVREPATGEYFARPMLNCSWGGVCTGPPSYSWIENNSTGAVTIQWTNSLNIKGTAINGAISSGGATYYRGSLVADYFGVSKGYAIYRTIP